MTRRAQLGLLAVLLSSVVWLAAAAAAAAPLSVRATVSSERVRVGETFTLSIEVRGAQSVAAPALSGIEGFQFRYVGPSTQVSIVNGQVSAAVEHRFSATAVREGEFQIGPFTVQHGGQVYETNAVRITVAAAAGLGGDGESLRLTLEIPRGRVYLHERVPVDVTLYVGDVTARDVQYPVLQASAVSVENFAQPSRTTQVIDGRRYEVLRFRGYVVPLQAGQRTLGPAVVGLNLVQQQRHLLFAQRQPMELRSNVVDMEVLPLPPHGRPDDFQGAVGRFSLDVDATPVQVEEGDPVTVRITVRGQGNFASLVPPAFRDQPGMRVYEPRRLEGEVPELRLFEQVVIAESAAITELPSLRLPYFDPEAGAYRVAQAPPIAIDVRASGLAAATAEARGREATPQRAPATLGRDIVYIKESAGDLMHAERRRLETWMVVAWQPVPVLFYFGVLLFDRHRRRLLSDERYARAQGAGRRVRADLLEAEKLLGSGDRRAFFDRVEVALREYLSARLGLPPGAIDAGHLRSGGIDDELVAGIQAVLADCEQVRFAPGAESGDAERVLASVRDIVASLERRRGLFVGQKTTV